MVFQSYALFPHLNVKDNILFGLRVRKVNKQEQKIKLQRVEELLGLDRILNSKPSQLSGGQKQRVALARSIEIEPDLLLLDEPLSNLDAKLRDEMRAELSRLQHQLEITMIYVTHDQVEAMTLGDRIAVMKSGKILQFDTPLNVYDKPVNRFVAGFIGSPPMNFVPGMIIAKDGSLYFDSGKFKLTIIERMKSALDKYVGEKIIFGIRPENIYDKLFASNATIGNTMRTICDVVETMGSYNYLYISVGKYNLIASVKGNNKPAAGSILEVVIDMERAHFFNPSTESTIV